MHCSPLERERLESEVLPYVTKPGRYLGIEQGAFRKPPDSAKVLMAMVFPDLYEIGVSNYGHRLLYSIVNREPDYLCDRAYAADNDMRNRLKALDLPLYGLETLIPLAEFDILAFTLQYELNYTTILGILESARIPFRTVDREGLISPSPQPSPPMGEREKNIPLLIAGGPGSGNPMPLSPFFDAFIIGDGEDVILEILELVSMAKSQGWSKKRIKEELSTLEGLFVPGVSSSAGKRIVDISKQNIDIAPLVPFIRTVHDRVTVEARRGCDRMCRFCQPCFVNLPVREQEIHKIRDQALKEIEKTGYEECSLLSLSIADYSQLKPLINEVSTALEKRAVSLSLPSQRADRFDIEIAQAIQKVRKSTLTFAPEAGTERLRAVLNKNLSEEEILNAVTSAYRAGWNKVKLYFMIGLPTETDEDLIGIRDMVAKMQAVCAGIVRDEKLSKKHRLEVNVTFSNFVPKPHTPFQWVSQDSMGEMRRKKEFLKQAFRGVKGVKLNFTDPEISKLEAIISRGDSGIADVIEKAYRKGAYLDAWDENLDFSVWFEALSESGMDPDEITARFPLPPIGGEGVYEPLPWESIHVGLSRAWLIAEYKKALEEQKPSSSCFTGCKACGVCPEFNITPILASPAPVSSSNIGKVRAGRKRFPQAFYKARLTIQKSGDLRFISHLDWLRMLHRMILKSGIPIAYSQGFNPTPKISFGPPLPMFVEGFEEYIDLTMLERTPNLKERLNEYLPESGKILQCQWIPLQSLSLDKMVRYFIYSAQWTCSFSQKRYTITERVDDLLTQPEWIVEAKKKNSLQRIDIKPFISDIHFNSFGDIIFTIRIDRQTEQIKPVWFLSLIDLHGTWNLKRLKVGLSDSRISKVIVKV